METHPPTNYCMTQDVLKAIEERCSKAKASIDWLKTQCNRYANGQCMTLGCLRRGGYEGGKPDYSKATCEAHEEIIALSDVPALVQEVKRLTEKLAEAEARAKRGWEAYGEAKEYIPSED